MASALRKAWKANRHCVAAGFLLSTGLFLLFIFLNWRAEQRGIEQSRAAGLSATAPTAWNFSSAWSQRSLLPAARSQQKVRSVDSVRGVMGGVVGGLTQVSFTPRLEPRADQTDRQVVRSGTLEVVATDPLQTAEQLQVLATRLSGFVVSSKVAGRERAQSAEVTVRIPAEHFDEARAQVKAIAKWVEQDTVEARDVTREYVDHETALRNARAEEQQYLLILKRAGSVKDVLEVSSNLAEVRGHIDELQGELRLLHHQVEMSLLTTNVTAVADAQVFGIRWRPLYKAKLSLRGAVSAMTDYADSMLELLANVPVIAIWAFTVVALAKLAWILLRRILLLFFPALASWFRRPVQTQAN